MCGQGLGMNISAFTIVYKMLYKLQYNDKDIAGRLATQFSFFFSLDISFHFFSLDIIATKSTVFQHLVFLAYSGSLFYCDSDSLRLETIGDDG